MFCPRCGIALTDTPGRPLECQPGEMPLSADLERRLRECYVDNGRLPRSEPLPFKVGGSWFCPGCGIRATEPRPGDVRCPSCGRALAEFIPPLVELHPHRRNTPA